MNPLLHRNIETKDLKSGGLHVLIQLQPSGSSETTSVTSASFGFGLIDFCTFCLLVPSHGPDLLKCVPTYSCRKIGMKDLQAGSAFGFVLCSCSLQPSGSSEMRVKSASQLIKIGKGDLIILITGPPKHHTKNESNHQHCRLGYGLRQGLSS